MGRFQLILVIIVFNLFFTMAQASDVYVYLLEGENLFLSPGATPGAKKEKIKSMTPIPDKSVLEIGENTTAWLTCAACCEVKLTRENSPFVVNQSSFVQKKSIPKIFFKEFTTALKAILYPDSTTGEFKQTFVRGIKSADGCDMLCPGRYSDIMIIGDEISFKWGMESGIFHFSLRNSSNDRLIAEAVTEKPFFAIPCSKLKPGNVYNWIVRQEEGNNLCQAVFSTASDSETRKVKKILNEIIGFLPENADRDTRKRLQASYLLSIGLDFNAVALLEANDYYF